MPHVEMVGIAFADFGIALLVAAGLAKARGPEDQAIVADLELDVAADRLDTERIVVIPRMDVGLVRGGRRGELVEQRKQSTRSQPSRVEAHITEQRVDGQECGSTRRSRGPAPK